MKIYLLRTLFLFLYLFIASQGMFYLIGLNKALHHISIAAFVEQRKALDAVIGDPLRFLYISSIVVGIVTLFSTIKNPGSIIFITVLLSFLCIVADMALAVTKSIPLNEIVNHYPGNNHPDMQGVREEWLSMIKIRGAIAITGLVILLSGILLESFKYKEVNDNKRPNLPSQAV